MGKETCKKKGKEDKSGSADEMKQTARSQCRGRSRSPGNQLSGGTGNQNKAKDTRKVEFNLWWN